MKLLAQLTNKLLLLLNRGHKRTVKAKKNILYSFIVKGGSIVISFFLIRITLGYVGKEDYGIWLTLSSIVSWFSFFDVGLGRGLLNRLAEAWAKDDDEKARAYVSSTYAILSIIFGGLLILFFIISPFIDWTKVFNTTSENAYKLRLVVSLVFSFFCFNFVFQLIYMIFNADQRSALKGLFVFIGNLISLLIIYVLTKTTEGSLLNLALSIGVVPLVVLIGVNFYYFNKDYKKIKPSIKYVKPVYFKDLTNLGLKFFFVKISALIIFSTDNMIITQLFGPAEVTPYGIAFKYFQIIANILNIMSIPLWAAYTEAYFKNDFDWIKKTNKTLLRIWVGMVVISGIMLIFSKFFMGILAPGVDVPFKLSLFMCLYFIIRAYGDIYVVFINGVGKVQLQLIVSVVGGILNIPLSYFFAKVLGMGTPGVILASIICIGFGPILAPIQYSKVINGKAKGIWNK